jgi:hypothetical protein
MNWKFTLIDRNNIATVIDEPVGWDACEIEVKRDLDKHGVFFDYQGNDFLFHGTGMRIIKAENDTYGVEGNTTLLIEQSCDDNLEELYRGKLLFSKYKFSCSDECYVRIPIETTSDVMELRNRWDQKVNLQTIKAFDETTSLPVYSKLPFNLELPSKGIFIQDSYLNEVDNGTPVLGVPLSQSSNINTQYGMLELAFSKQKASEIGNAGTEIQPLYTCALSTTSAECNSPNRFLMSNANGANTAFVAPLDISAIVNFQEGTLNYEAVSNPCTLDIDIKGSVTNISSTRISAWFVVCILPIGKSGVLDSDYTYLYQTNVIDGNAILSGGEVFNISASYSNLNFPLNKGDRIFSFYSMYHARPDTNNPGGNTNAFSINYEPNSFFKLTNLSRTPSSISKVFMINEALSRTCEAITNNTIKVYSEHFGRTDSQPYSHAADGCGSLDAITKGLFVRKQENRIPNKPFQFNVSMQDLWQGIEPLHHIGMGIEADTNRTGFNRLRIEPWQHFYTNDLLMSCVNVNKIDVETIENEHYSTFKFGFDKWEAEEYTGLDEFLTKREYRTTLKEIKNELSKFCKFIYSGYALEITRRKADQDSKDWRYDNDTFGVCCKRQINGDIVVELGNVLNPQNIIDPTTLYNYRNSPIRIAMRWIDKIFASYKQANPNNKIIFTDGDGNYHAKGLMESLFCRLENQQLEENQEINNSIFIDALKAMPLLKPERVDYDYPMSLQDFKAILANPYGQIFYSSDCESGYGWIDIIKYKPEEGLANFKLIPKY